MEWGEAVGPLFSAIIAHHGRPVEQPAAHPTPSDWPACLQYDWQDEAEKMRVALQIWFVGIFESGGEPLPGNPLFHHEVAGLVSLADWTGSDTRFFPFTEPSDLSYDAVARDAARKALTTIRLDPGTLATRPAPAFSALTGFPEANPALIRLPGCPKIGVSPL